MLCLLSCSAPSSFQPSTLPISSIAQEQDPLPVPHSLGVLPFDYHGEYSGWEWLRQGLSDMLVTDLAVWPGIDIVSRQSLGAVLREQWLQHRGTSDPGSSVRLGQLSGARYLLKGSFFVIGHRLTVDVHVLDVEHGFVVRATRLSDALEALPALTHQLANHIGGFFGPLSEKPRQPIANDTLRSSDASQPSQDMVRQRILPFAPTINKQSSPQSHIHPADMPLRLLQTQRRREEAWHVADEVWQQGFTIELGAPSFSGTSISDVWGHKQDFVWVPVTSYFVPERLRNIHRLVKFSLLENQNNDDDRGIMRWQDDNVNTSQLFVERFRTPRRVFVRAISSSGEVIGVASPWSWRTDHALDSSENRVTEIPVWPTPMIVGDVAFSAKMLAHYQNISHFDAVVVSVPGEHRMISVEMIEPAEEQASSISRLPGLQAQILDQVKHWLSDNWEPYIAESLPVHGYLPGNRRTLQMRIAGRGGTVDGAEMIQRPDEEMLGVGGEQLVRRLIGQCFGECEAIAKENSEDKDVFHMRVQLDLSKDLQHVGLGAKVTK